MNHTDTKLFKAKAVLGLGHQAMLGLWNKKGGGGNLLKGVEGLDSWPRYSSTAASNIADF